MTFTVNAGFHARRNCPVSIVLPLDAAKAWAVRPVNSDVKFPCAVEACEEGAKLTFILPALQAGQSLQFAVEEACPCCAAKAPACRSEVLEDKVDVTVSGRHYINYNFPSDLAKPFLGPIYGAYGEQITRLNPDEREHPHHRCLWFSHGSVNGVDTWNEPANCGFIRNHGIENVFDSSVFTRFTTCNTWTDHDGKPLLEDRTTLTFYASPADARFFDAEITLTAAYGDVTLGATKEAGPIAIRVNYNLTVPNTGRFENAEGSVNEDEIWMKRSAWVDYYGIQDGHTVGVTIMDAPDNERHPAYWHARNYGLFAPNNYYLGGDRIIPAGESMTVKYRIYAHAGDTRAANVSGVWHDFAHPPKAVADEEAKAE